MAEWLRTDEKKEAFESLRLANRLLVDVETDPYLWKWVIITTHMAFQANMVLALAGTMPLRVLSNESARQVAAGTPGAVRQLASFMQLYRRVKSAEMMKQNVDSKPLVATPDQDDAVRYLHETLRNKFEHFQPRGWSIAIDDLPITLFQCVSIISFLALESGNVFWHESPSRQQMSLAIRGLRFRLGRLHRIRMHRRT